MALRLAFVMDPLEGISIHEDTTFAWLLEAQARGHESFFVGPGGLSLRRGVPLALAAPLAVQPVEGSHFSVLVAERMPLAEFDVVFMRKDPPVDLEYLYATHILSQVEPPTLVLNEPRALREANEKLYALEFPDLCPPALVSRDTRQIRDFVHAQGGTAVVKPLDGAGGASVVIAREEDPNFTVLLEMSTALGRRTVIVQRFLKEAAQGDKRVILVGGEPVGAVLRVPSGEGEHRGNIHVGGRCVPTELSEREHRACEAMKERLLADGLHFVGLDFIGGWLTEVNVTSPTGIQEIRDLGGSDIAALWLDYVEGLAT